MPVGVVVKVSKSDIRLSNLFFYPGSQHSIEIVAVYLQKFVLMIISPRKNKYSKILNRLCMAMRSNIVDVFEYYHDADIVGEN